VAVWSLLALSRGNHVFAPSLQLSEANHIINIFVFYRGLLHFCLMARYPFIRRDCSSNVTSKVRSMKSMTQNLLYTQLSTPNSPENLKEINWHVSDFTANTKPMLEGMQC
jgi:hypothetical protein